MRTDPLTPGQLAQLLAEVDDLLVSVPPMSEFPNLTDNALAWLGRAGAVVERWDFTNTPWCQDAATKLRSTNLPMNVSGYGAIKTLLHQARAALRFETGQASVVVAQGRVFEYFDEVRKLVATARNELFFVDAYLDADFVVRYLPHAAAGVSVRLLTSPAKLAMLLPAVDLFVRESGTPVSVRSSAGLHDRFLFVDRSAVHVSGASFKDGAKNAPALVSQITDAFPQLWSTYDGHWNAAKVERV